MRFKESYHIYAAITIVFWSLAYVLTRLALQYFSAFSLGFLRYLVASCTLLLVAVFTKMKRPKKESLPLLALSGALGFFLYMITFNKGVETVTAATSSIVIATVPVITALLARLLHQEKLRAFQWVAIGVELLGVVLLTLLDGVFSMDTGLFWLFLAALCLSLYNLLQRKLTQSHSAFESAAYSIFFGTLLLSIFLPNSLDELSGAPPIQLFYLAMMGIGSSAIAYVAWAKAFSKAEKASQVSNYMFLTPFLTSILGFFLAKEVPDFATVAGGSVILIGTFLFHFGTYLFHPKQRENSTQR